MLNQVVLVGRISSINKETMNRDEGNKRFTTRNNFFHDVN